MIHIKSFVCNPYQENTYLLYDDTGVAAIIDPGMYGSNEEQQVKNFIDAEGLRPELLLNTHCHVDHVLGNRFIHETYGLFPQFHEGELPLLMEVQNYAPQMGIRYDLSPIGETFLPASGTVTFGENTLALIFAPGHSPAHLCFYSAADGFLIGGDVLFRNSIGRTDLPGGNHQQLLDSITHGLYTLPEDTVVYPGHGPETTIGYEKKTNPFIRG
ncbi:MBL fold metallo-hydrolase [Parapedobacter sp. ISTM3]|uniref:Glyoxylase, beta-lactamase superfamily II n=1 Tax=Parapedobacter luteus TaxID=623280 RepID=A0A1T5CW75_9SPHI|nr:MULTISPECIES: MBL fold metallo-hydrolase [Parapedobacter]MBK1440675.1 MBL fold metallo-hydrolase [Parapedobacter sp. ISTM3]SKB63682.1 Glyoxylase, beta-lactamase superfamily II [Parapedobacter luteus]